MTIEHIPLDPINLILPLYCDYSKIIQNISNQFPSYCWLALLCCLNSNKNINTKNTHKTSIMKKKCTRDGNSRGIKQGQSIQKPKKNKKYDK